MTLPRWLGTSFVLAALLGVRGAEAAPEEAMSLSYEREPSLGNVCPDREKFLELLRRQRPNVVMAAPGTPARSFAITLHREGRSIAGELVVIELDGTTNARSLHEASCPALVAALAVVTAIALDERPAAAPPEAPAEVEPAPLTRPPRPAKRPLTIVRPAPPSTHVAVGLDTELVLGSLPRGRVGYRAYGEVQRPAREWLVAGRLSLAFASAQLPGTQRLDVFVQIWSARAEGCAGRPLARGVVLEGCAAVTAGVYHSYSTHAIGARDDVRSWLTLGAGARLRWHPTESPYFSEIYGGGAYAATAYSTVARDGSPCPPPRRLRCIPRWRRRARSIARRRASP